MRLRLRPGIIMRIECRNERKCVFGCSKASAGRRRRAAPRARIPARALRCRCSVPSHGCTSGSNAHGAAPLPPRDKVAIDGVHRE